MEEDNEYIEEWDSEPLYFRGEAISSGNKQTFACPNCGSYNTEQSVYYELCNTCGWSQGY